MFLRISDQSQNKLELETIKSTFRQDVGLLRYRNVADSGAEVVAFYFKKDSIVFRRMQTGAERSNKFSLIHWTFDKITT